MKHAGRRRLLFSKNLILMLVMLFVIILAAFAWFTGNPEAEASGIKVSSKRPNEISLAKVITSVNGQGNPQEGPGEFSQELEFPGPYSLSRDCTGDGVTLIVPDFEVINDKMDAKANGKKVNLNGSASNATSQVQAAEYHEAHPESDMPEYQYIEHQFYIRSTNKEISLKPESILLSESEYSNPVVKLSQTPAAKKSSYGDFNVDALVGAMRVSLVGRPAINVNQAWIASDDPAKMKVDEETNPPTCTLKEPERQMLWVPRPDVFLDVKPRVDSWDDWVLHTGILRTTTTQDSTNTRISDMTYRHQYYKGQGSSVSLMDDADAVISESALNSAGAVSLGQTVNIAHYASNNQPETSSLRVNSDANITGQNASADYYVYKIIMKVWIEGTDAEARRAMDGGKFKLSLEFGL